MFKLTKTSREKELEGVWAEYDVGSGQCVNLKIARIPGNVHYENTLAKLMEPHKKKMKSGGDVSNATAKRIMNKVLAEDILLGWEEIPDDDGKVSDPILIENGKPYKYSKENAFDLLNSDHDLMVFVEEFAKNQSNYLDLEKTAGK